MYMKRKMIKNSFEKPINNVLSLSLVFFIGALIFYNISASIELNHLKEDIIFVNISIEKLKDDILVEKNKNVILVRNTIRDKAEKLGMNKISNKKRINGNVYRWRWTIIDYIEPIKKELVHSII